MRGSQCDGSCGSGGGFSGLIASPDWQAGVNSYRSRALPRRDLRRGTGNRQLALFSGTLVRGDSRCRHRRAAMGRDRGDCRPGDRPAPGATNAMLYGLGTSNTQPPVFHDVTWARISSTVPHRGGTSLGWGSPDRLFLVSALQASARYAGDPAIAMSAPGQGASVGRPDHHPGVGARPQRDGERRGAD